MTDKLELSDKTLSTIAHSAERFIGYLYAGILPLAILTIEEKAFVSSFVSSTGGILVALICLTFGVGIFTVYFRLFGELLLYPLQHLFHVILDFLFRKTGDKHTSTVGLLVAYGVPLLNVRDAYETIKESYFEQTDRTNLQVSHGELHVLYLTSTVCFLSYAILSLTKGVASSGYIFVGVFSLIAALIGDTRQHAKEAFKIRANKEDVVKFLKAAGFITND